MSEQMPEGKNVGLNALLGAPRYGYTCFNCDGWSPMRHSQRAADEAAHGAGWLIGHYDGRAQIVCADCKSAVWDALPLVPMHYLLKAYEDALTPNAQVKRRAERSEDCPLEPVVGQSDGAA